MKMAILELEYKNIRKITALKLPFTKADGSVISNNFIMMANGTGKTTTMELIKGLTSRWMDCVQSAFFRAYINGSRYR